MTTITIAKRYQLLYRNDDGSARFQTVTAEGSELLTIHRDGSMSTHLIVGFCMPCLEARLKGEPGCDWPECTGRDSSVPVHDQLPAVEEPVSEPVKVPEPDMEEPAAAPVTVPHVSELVERSAKQVAAKVWSEGECSRAVFNADSAEKWLAHAVAIGWVIVDDNGQVKRGSVNPVPAEPVLSYREARTRWGPDWIG